METRRYPAGPEGQSGSRREMPRDAETRRIGDWLRIDPDGGVTVFTGKVEVGQGIRTSLAQAVAEELRVPPQMVRLVMADTALVPFDAGTFGSRTTPTMAHTLRLVAASAREVLLDRAAERLGVPRSELVAAEGRVSHPPSGRSLGYAELAGGEELAEDYREDAPLTPPSSWSVLGRPLPRARMEALVTGSHRYPSDVALPGMLIAKVVRPPLPGCRLLHVDTTEAEAMEGVRVVRDGDFLAVAAEDSFLASQAAAAVRAEWERPEVPSDEELYEYLKAHPMEPDPDRPFPQPLLHQQGSLELGLGEAEIRHAAEYRVAYIAHVPPETRAATAVWEGERLTVWTGTQRPFGVRAELAAFFGIPEDQVRVIVPDAGSGYGGKHTGEAAIEAARVARILGVPVKVHWTRQEELTHAYFRPAGVIDVRSGATRDGKLRAWEFHNYNSGPAAIMTPYDVPHQHIEYHPCRSPLRQGSYRALAATANHFARESHMDELAHMLEVDPLEFRLDNTSDGRLRAVLLAAAEAYGWVSRRRRGHRGHGLACGTEKGSYVATCAEVEVDPDTQQVRVVRIVQAFECGAIHNPDLLRNQVEGAIVQGLGGALYERVRIEGGNICNGRLSLYRVPRFTDLPSIEVVLLDRRDLPAVGAGETPLVCVAPALANAIFDATGQRLRSLPLLPDGRLPARA